MKKILNLATLFIAIGCSAQSPVINITNDSSMAEGCYNKDVDNVLPQFEGNYLYTNTATNTTLEIRMIKKIMQFDGHYYEDLIIGEYEYKVNGVTIISTLANLNTVYPSQEDHNIAGNSIIKKVSRYTCNDCGTNERRLLLGFSDPTTPIWSRILVRKILVGGSPAIKILFLPGGGNMYMVGTPPPPDPKVPSGEYILMKQ